LGEKEFNKKQIKQKKSGKESYYYAALIANSIMPQLLLPLQENDVATFDGVITVWYSTAVSLPPLLSI
jgi:hypothetical protein